MGQKETIATDREMKTLMKHIRLLLQPSVELFTISYLSYPKLFRYEVLNKSDLPITWLIYLMRTFTLPS